jgi:hypothetical protein
MAKELGNTKDGHRIIARACAEDNSGIVAEVIPGERYEARFSYPVDFTMKPGARGDDDEDYEAVYVKVFAKREDAVQSLRNETGYARFEQHGPGF